MERDRHEKTQSHQAELNLIRHKAVPRAFETETEMHLLASSNKWLILNQKKKYWDNTMNNHYLENN